MSHRPRHLAAAGDATVGRSCGRRNGCVGRHDHRDEYRASTSERLLTPPPRPDAGAHPKDGAARRWTGPSPVGRQNRRCHCLCTRQRRSSSPWPGQSSRRGSARHQHPSQGLTGSRARARAEGHEAGSTALPGRAHPRSTRAGDRWLVRREWRWQHPSSMRMIFICKFSLGCLTTR